MGEKRKIIMDCDPGIDDAVAICLAAAYTDCLELLGITTVSGNQTLEKVTQNALQLTEFLGLDIPVASGQPASLLGFTHPIAGIHGENGLGHFVLPESEKQTAGDNAVIFLRDTIMNLPKGEKVTLVPTGPLTNIALLLKVFPEVKERIEQIVLMGGSKGLGNQTAAAEYNIYIDPEAAKIVFESEIPVVMCGLNVTEECVLSRMQIAKLCQSKGEVSSACGEMLGYYISSPAYVNCPYAAVHDATTIMYLTHPEIFKTEYARVHVDCSSGISRGQTICDTRIWEYGNHAWVKVLTEVDKMKFQELLIEALFELDYRKKS